MLNWKVRFKNKTFWVAIIPAMLLLIQTVLALAGVEWNYDLLNDQLLAIVNALFAVLTILGIVVDPTTAGVKDSKRVMGYDEPSK